MSTETPPKLSNSTRIYFNESAHLTECHNHTVLEEFIDQNQWQTISIISALINGLLLILLIGE
ncbi:hypothetical protein cypCar_00045429 [Cyprinus carpio]|nr:hypothetical protein cypCar_00045429 [Cyprinus carpio]